MLLNLVVNRRWMCIALALAFCTFVTSSTVIEAKGAKAPESRAKAVESAAKHNSKASAIAVMAALKIEDDGPVGYRMSNALVSLDSPDALKVIKKTIMKWTSPQQLMGAYWVCRGLAMQGNPNTDDVIREILMESKKKDIYLKAAVLEAVAESKRHEFADLYIETLKLWDSKWQTKSPVLALTIAAGAHKLVGNDNKDALHKMVLGLADALEKTTDQRIMWYIVESLSKMTGEDSYVTPGFWRFWVKAGGKKVSGEDDGPTSAGVNVPKFFKAKAVGKRVVFVIDVSGSMRGPVTLTPEMKHKPDPVEEEKGEVSGESKAERKKREKAEREKAKKKVKAIDPPDYSKVKTKMDLAIVELVYTLKSLPDDYTFNVVVYDTTHRLLMSSVKTLVQATKANKDKFVRKVEALQPLSLTNIHGGLMRGFCLNEVKSLNPMKLDANANPAWDVNCLNSGATTMFFLTDGSATASDDSTSNNGAQGGNGRYVDPQNIVTDIQRVNVFRKVVINTIGIGQHDNRLMLALAEMTGGTYVDRSGA